MVWCVLRQWHSEEITTSNSATVVNLVLSEVALKHLGCSVSSYPR